MVPEYYVIEASTGRKIPAQFRKATKEDFLLTETNHWQTNWLSEYIEQDSFEKYALEVTETQELVGLGAYREEADSITVYIAYIESAPGSNPTLVSTPEYLRIGAALLAYGVQLSLDFGYDGSIFFKAKTSKLREHYINVYGAQSFSHRDPYLLLIEGKAAEHLFYQFLKEES